MGMFSPFSEIGELDKVFHKDGKMKERKLVSFSICEKYLRSINTFLSYFGLIVLMHNFSL